MELTRALTVSTLEGGAVIERLEAALKEVLNDCGDINKLPDSVREIACKIKIKPDETRTILMIGIDVNTKLGQRYPVMARAFFDEDTCEAIEPTGKQGGLFEEHDKEQVKKNLPERMTIVGGSRE
jgi:hypothetical protein